MTINRKLPTTTTDPSGLGGSSYASQVAEEVEALWRIAGEPLGSVAGTNTITATPLVSTTGFAAYEAGNRFSLIPANTNSGAVTINIAGRGAKSIVSAAGAALSSGDLTAGTQYTIEYDGTDFRLAGGGGAGDIGSLIYNATAKTALVDADALGLTDSADSNAGKKVTVANLRTAIAPMVMHGEDEPTSDSSSISETGLSIYRDVRIDFAVYMSSIIPSIHFEARASGGTWRRLFSYSGSSGQDTMLGHITLQNFGRANDIKFVSAIVSRLAGTALDRSDALQGDSSPAAFNYISTYDEQWDEFQIITQSGNLEGSSSNNCSIVRYSGVGKGD